MTIVNMVGGGGTEELVPSSVIYDTTSFGYVYSNLTNSKSNTSYTYFKAKIQTTEVDMDNVTMFTGHISITKDGNTSCTEKSGTATISNWYWDLFDDSGIPDNTHGTISFKMMGGYRYTISGKEYTQISENSVPSKIYTIEYAKTNGVISYTGTEVFPSSVSTGFGVGGPEAAANNFRRFMIPVAIVCYDN